MMPARTMPVILLALLPVAAHAGSDALAGAGVPAGQDQAMTITTTARNYLERHLRSLYPDARQVSLQAVGRVRPPKALPVNVLLVPGLIQPAAVSRRMCVQVDGAVDGNVVASVPVCFAAAVYAPVLVAGRALRTNEPVTEADFVLAERDLAVLGKQVLVAPADVRGKRARRYIVPGAAVTAEDVVAAPAVARSQTIQVEVVTPSVVIATKGIAQEDGVPGQVIKVRSAASDAVYFAQVVDAGRAQLVSREMR
jgi:flagella basal body P-ring formation protein FlgA